MERFTCRTSDHTLSVDLVVQHLGQVRPGVWCARFVMHGHEVLNYYDAFQDAGQVGGRLYNEEQILRAHGLDPDTLTRVGP